MNDIKKVILEAYQWRDACKYYDKTKKIPVKDMSFILETARLSPSAFGYEPWNFLVFENLEVLEKIRSVSWGMENSLNGASHIVFILARKKIDLQAGTDYVEYMMNEVQNLTKEVLKRRRRIFNGFLEDDLGVVTDKEVFGWACKQTFIPLANMLSTAALLKIDACPIEGFNYKKVEEIFVQEGLLDIKHFGISAAVSFGYRSREPGHSKTRQPIDKIVRYIK